MRRSRPRPRRASGPHWSRVQARVRCDEGEWIDRPAWALFWPYHPGFRRGIKCVVHAAEYGYDCPHLYTLTQDAPVDVRARQAGDE